MSNKETFKKKYFTDNFYWITERNYEIIQMIALEMGCVNPVNGKSLIKWHEGFNNLGVRTKNGVTKFQKEPFLIYGKKATSFEEMYNDWVKLD